MEDAAFLCALPERAEGCPKDHPDAASAEELRDDPLLRDPRVQVDRRARRRALRALHAQAREGGTPPRPARGAWPRPRLPPRGDSSARRARACALHARGPDRRVGRPSRRPHHGVAELAAAGASRHVRDHRAGDRTRTRQRRPRVRPHPRDRRDRALGGRGAAVPAQGLRRLRQTPDGGCRVVPQGRWTAADIPDQSGRTAIVTGSNSGIGAEAAKALARAGAHVVIACRNVQKGEQVAREIAAGGGEARVEQLDLADLESVTAFAERVDGPLDLLINNAGVMAPPRTLTKDGFESQFGTNHLGHFALTGLLVTNLLEAADPRVVTISSPAHRLGSIKFDDLQREHGY